jgi:hypothetical protein
MDQFDEESFLDELMSLPRPEQAPEPEPEPWQAMYPGSSTTMSELIFHGGDQGASGQARNGLDIAPFQEPMAPPPLQAAPPRPHEEFNFDYLSEVCNPYRGFVPGPGFVGAAGQTLTHPFHDAMAEDETSGDKLFHGGGSTFIFGGGGAGGMMVNGMIKGDPGDNPRSKLNGGAPSKNLMAERRRRKRLNDRLSMLRSIVPKISKVTQ